MVSVFVNPAQFNDKKDLLKYRRDGKADLIKAEKAGTDLVFLPAEAEMYPPGFQTWIEAGGLSGALCGPFRPGHFRGAATVVAKLVNLVEPSRAYLGLKDYQQLKIVERMVRDLGLKVRIVACPTVREADGLAMSSRNRRLSPPERRRAASLFRSLQSAADLIESKKLTKRAALLEHFKRGLDLGGKDRVEYVQAVHPETLRNQSSRIGPPVLLAAALWIGRTRLIDNIKVGDLHG